LQTGPATSCDHLLWDRKKKLVRIDLKGTLGFSNGWNTHPNNKAGLFKPQGSPKAADEGHLKTICGSCSTPVKFEINHKIEVLIKRKHA
jgi:hypothetical protein